MHNLGVRSVFFVQDTPRAIGFYSKNLGFTLDWTYEENGQPYVAQVSFLGLQIILNQKESPEDVRAGHGRIYIGLDDEQSAAVLNHVQAKGIAAAYTEWGEPTMTILDSDGNEIFFWLSDAEHVKWKNAHTGTA